MDWLKFFRGEKKSSAQAAKERLMVAVAIQRAQLGRSEGPAYLHKMREEIVAVVRKYVQVPDTAVQFNLQHEDGLEVLELNIALPENATVGAPAA